MSSSYTSRTLCLVVVVQISTFVHSIVGIVVPCTHDANSVAHLSRLTTVSDRFMPNEAFCETRPFARTELSLCPTTRVFAALRNPLDHGTGLWQATAQEGAP
jgi:hypothetical protein